MAGKMKVEVALRVRLLPKPALRAQNAGEIVCNMGCGEGDVRAAQEGFSRQWFSKVVVYGLNQYGQAQDLVAFSVDGTASDTDMISIDADETVSSLQRTDAAYGTAITRAAARFARRSLSPMVRFWYIDEIAQDPARRAQCNAELGLVDRDPVETDPTYDIDLVAIRPGRDKGQRLELGYGRRRL